MQKWLGEKERLWLQDTERSDIPCPQMPEPPARRPTPTHQFLVLSLPTLVLPQHWPGPGFRGKARRAVAGWGGWRGGPGQPDLHSKPTPLPAKHTATPILFRVYATGGEERSLERLPDHGGGGFSPPSPLSSFGRHKAD